MKFDLQKIRELSNLELLARQLVEGFITGLHKSPYHGFSVEFAEHRLYNTGESTKDIDWKVYARTDRLFSKRYEEETNLRCTILLDSSGSMSYNGSRSNGLTKHDYAVRTAACLAYLMLQQQDAVGLVTFDKTVRRYIPPRARPKHTRALVDELRIQTLRFDQGGQTDLN